MVLEKYTSRDEWFWIVSLLPKYNNGYDNLNMLHSSLLVAHINIQM